jgi:hypothetical protein
MDTPDEQDILTPAQLDGELVSISMDMGFPEFYIGADYHISRDYAEPTAQDGITICLEQIKLWQSALTYFQRRMICNG